MGECMHKYTKQAEKHNFRLISVPEQVFILNMSQFLATKLSKTSRESGTTHMHIVEEGWIDPAIGDKEYKRRVTREIVGGTNCLA